MDRDLDLIILAADRSIRTALDALLSRFPLRGGSARLDFLVPGTDSVAFHQAVELLRGYLRRAKYALMILDFQWSHNFPNSTDMYANLKGRLDRNGWSERCEVIVIDPMLESWAWADIQTLARCISPKYAPQVQQALMNQKPAHGKPADPKKALRDLRLPGIRRVPGFKLDDAFYNELAWHIPKQVILRCQDPSFVKLRSALSSWFGPWP
ncbi:hypothetical protein [Thermoflexus sp.]|uniref:hypothetical protein n=1 Tax=Thermoflexus sp. TaxID=1969742 RepID=UPI0026215F56|nr:hypothetical protein [Thermoflexus sp.]MCX7691467.1 hypothetical protein [Thermoflexus sp.]